MWPPTHFIVVSAGDGSSDGAAGGSPGLSQPPVGKSHTTDLVISSSGYMN